MRASLRPSAPPSAGGCRHAGGDAGKRPGNADLTGEGTILLVEDEEGLRQLNARGLASRGYTVLEAANGVEAIEVLERHGGKVDLVVSDVVMPEMDGPTLLRELRSRNPSLKIIFVSGYAEDAFQKHLPADGQFAFLAKPFTLKQLVNEVKETLAGLIACRSRFCVGTPSPMHAFVMRTAVRHPRVRRFATGRSRVGRA